MAEASNLVVGKTINKRYKLTSILGSGGFGKVFKAYDKRSKSNCAIKFQLSADVKTIDAEIKIMESLTDVDGICQILGSGTYANSKYIVMQLVGPDIASLRQLTNTKYFSKATAHNLAISTLQCIRNMHTVGVVHNDIKPSNFAVGHDDQRKIYLLDFGAAKKVAEGEKTDESEVCVATPMYASFRQHEGQSTGPSDDLASWFYMSVENFSGKLPWRSDDDDPNNIYNLKKSISVGALLADVFPEYREIYEYIFGLNSDSVPNYAKIFFTLEMVSLNHKLAKDAVYDWEGQTYKEDNS